MGLFDVEGVVVGMDVWVGEEVSEGVWVDGGVGDEPFLGVKKDKETARKPKTNAVKTKKTAIAIYCFFIMKHQCNYEFICSMLKPSE